MSENSEGKILPYVIETTGTNPLTGTSGNFVQAYETVEQALASVEDRNRRAEEMGLKARYRLRSSP